MWQIPVVAAVIFLATAPVGDDVYSLFSEEQPFDIFRHLLVDNLGCNCTEDICNCCQQLEIPSFNLDYNLCARISHMPKEAEVRFRILGDNVSLIWDFITEKELKKLPKKLKELTEALGHLQTLPLQCKCCAHIDAPTFGLDNQVCVTISHLPKEDAFRVEILWDDVIVIQQSISEKGELKDSSIFQMNEKEFTEALDQLQMVQPDCKSVGENHKCCAHIDVPAFGLDNQLCATIFHHTKESRFRVVIFWDHIAVIGMTISEKGELKDLRFLKLSGNEFSEGLNRLGMVQPHCKCCPNIDVPVFGLANQDKIELCEESVGGTERSTLQHGCLFTIFYSLFHCFWFDMGSRISWL